ncbi:MAG: agmatinase [Bacteroidales bacterium]|nr:agmatinase [Bacteroidales bacterium]MDD6782390.1 agmatinase [Bacteroidales bacterium]
MENFAGLTPPYSDYETSKIVVLPVPYDATSSWVHGAEKGPEKLLEASVQLEWYDTETRTEVYKHGIHTAQPVDEQRSPEHLCAAVEQRVGALFDDAKFPVTIGGNHTVSIGAIRAAAQRYDNLTVLQLDAHSDLRRTYEGSELNHACVMNQAKKVAHITQVGIRSQCIEETDNFEPERIFWARDIYFDHTCQWEEKAYATLTQNVYLTIDLDVFDTGILAATGTPEPGGLHYFQVLHFLRPLFERFNVVGCDIVELCPKPNLHASDYLAARLAYQLMTYKFLQK